ncbi:MAG: hypothetical protein WBM07_02475 [Chitinivibrionales bacterium]
MNLQSWLQKTLLLLFLSATCVFADSNKVGTYNVGAAAGFVTGYGLSYRQWFDNNGIQLTLTPYYSKSSTETYYNVSFGVTGLRMIKEANYVNLFLYYGPHFWHSYDKYPTYNYANSSSDTIARSTLLFLGGGPGFDFHFWRMSFNLMFGLAFRTDFVDNSGIQFTGETGLYYSF